MKHEKTKDMKTIRKHWIALLMLMATWPAVQVTADSFDAWVNAYAHYDGYEYYVPDSLIGIYNIYMDDFYSENVVFEEEHYDWETGKYMKEGYYIYEAYEQYDYWYSYGSGYHYKYRHITFDPPLGPLYPDEEGNLKNEHGSLVARFCPKDDYYETNDRYRIIREENSFYFENVIFEEEHYDEETGNLIKEGYYIYEAQENYYEWEYDEDEYESLHIRFDPPIGPLYRDEKGNLTDEDGDIVANFYPHKEYFERSNSWDSLRLTFNVTDPVNKTCEVLKFDYDELKQEWDFSDEESTYWGYIEYIEIPETVTRAEDGTMVTYTVTGIGDRAFQRDGYYYQIQELILPETIKRIGDMAFESAGYLDYDYYYDGDYYLYDDRTFFCNIPSQLEYIGDFAFANCHGFSLSIPANVRHIGNGAFVCCNLKKIEVSPDNPLFDSREGCNCLIETATNNLLSGSYLCWIPEGIEKIDDYAFLGNEPKSLTLPQSLLSIGKYAISNYYFDSYDYKYLFHDESEEEPEMMAQKHLKQKSDRGIRKWDNYSNSIIIPSQVREIGEGAFYYCDLDTITSLIPTPFPIEENVFNDWTYYDDVLMVPSSSVHQYLSTESWNLFGTIHGLSLGKKGDVNSDDEVNILDLVTLVNHINGRTSAAFIHEAADLWEDNKINVQDLVCLVNQLMELGESRRQSIIMHDTAQDPARAEAIVGCRGGQLVIDSEKAIAAFDIIIDDATAFQVSQALRQAGMTCQMKKYDNQIHLIGYSLTGEVLPAGEHVIGIANSQQPTVVSAMLADQDAKEIITSINNEATGISTPAHNADDKDVYQIAVGADAVIHIKADGRKLLKHHSTSLKNLHP
jgi:hypothetical protein